MARGVELGLDALRKASGTARMSRGRKKGAATNTVQTYARLVIGVTTWHTVVRQNRAY